MKRLTGILLAVILAVVGLSIASAPTASAGTQLTVITNIDGAPVDLYCHYGAKKKSGTIVDNNHWGKHISTLVCPIDVDEWYQKDKRCFHFAGPKYKDGYYWVNPGRFKMSGLAYGKFYAVSKCKGKKIVGTWTLKK